MFYKTYILLNHENIYTSLFWAIEVFVSNEDFDSVLAEFACRDSCLSDDDLD